MKISNKSGRKVIHLLPVIMSLVLATLISQPASAADITGIDNLMQTEAAANGHFRVYPSDEPLTSASIVNFNNGVTMANATVARICQVACVADIDIYSSVDSHVVVDSMGYYE
jgi:hypothetical protein